MNRRKFFAASFLLFSARADAVPEKSAQTVQMNFVTKHFVGQGPNQEKWVVEVLVPQLQDTLKRHEMRLHIERRRTTTEAQHSD